MIAFEDGEAYLSETTRKCRTVSWNFIDFVNLSVLALYGCRAARLYVYADRNYIHDGAQLQEGFRDYVLILGTNRGEVGVRMFMIEYSLAVKAIGHCSKWRRVAHPLDVLLPLEDSWLSL